MRAAVRIRIYKLFKTESWAGFKITKQNIRKLVSLVYLNKLSKKNYKLNSTIVSVFHIAPLVHISFSCSVEMDAGDMRIVIVYYLVENKKKKKFLEAFTVYLTGSKLATCLIFELITCYCQLQWFI